MKILSDFDGVLTNLTSEALRVAEIFESKLSELSDLPRPQIREWLDRARLAMRQRPYEFGWKAKGRIAAFCNEDGFIRVNALGFVLDEWADAGDASLVEIRKSIQAAGVESFYALAQTSYLEMTRETSLSEHKPLENSAAAVLKRLLDRGDEVVVVSNSGTERICQMLEGAGLHPVSHDPTKMAFTPGRLTVRGDAGKNVLGDCPDTFQVGEYTVDTDRPKYQKILMEEKPDVVVGDVFSLDLSLPALLASRSMPGFERLQVWLRKRDYTPDWSLEFFESNTGVKGGILEGFDELLAIVV